jgi:leucine dehydrogenase
LINVYSEIANYNRAESLRKTEDIFNTTLKIFQQAEADGTTNHAAAVKLAQARIDNTKRTVSNYAH